MPEKHQKEAVTKADWLKIELYSPPEMVDALMKLEVPAGVEVEIKSA